MVWSSPAFYILVAPLQQVWGWGAGYRGWWFLGRLGSPWCTIGALTANPPGLLGLRQRGYGEAGGATTKANPL